jgi:hypothetical protein
MPRWLGALIMVALGFVGVYQWIADPYVQLGGFGRLNRWQSRLFLGLFAAFCIGAGIAIWFS